MRSMRMNKSISGFVSYLEVVFSLRHREGATSGTSAASPKIHSRHTLLDRKSKRGHLPEKIFKNHVKIVLSSLKSIIINPPELFFYQSTYNRNLNRISRQT